MSGPLLRTKHYAPPPRQDLVPRPRLMARLDAALRERQRLVLVSAPAGSGKTTLVSAWQESIELPAAWLSLDAGDNDPLRFFAYLISALRRIHPSLGRSLGNLLEAAAAPSPDGIVGTLINDIAAAQVPLVLILDDYHTIDELAVHQAIGQLLERLPAGMLVAVLTRQDPPLPLSRLRARAQMTELRQRDLRFTAEEAAAFLHVSLGLDLSPADIEILETRTEGWIAGLQMAGLSLQGRDADSVARFVRSFSGTQRFVIDYLADEVLAGLDETLRGFLLQTSVLERLCGSLCDAVCDAVPSGRTTGQETLRQLELGNLFVVPLDEHREWYRYHHLFADILRVRLEEEYPGMIPTLHRRAAVWYEEKGHFSEAVPYAIASGDAGFAADTIQRAVYSIATWSGASASAIQRWIGALPPDLVQRRPWLQLYASRSQFVAGQWDAAMHTRERLQAWLEAHPDAPDAGAVLGSLAADQASYAAVRGEVRQAVGFARQALERLPVGEVGARMRAYSILGMGLLRGGDLDAAHAAFGDAIDCALRLDLQAAAVPLVCNLVEIQILQGKLSVALRTCEKARIMGTVDGVLNPSAGFAGIQAAKILYERNDLDAAERHVREGLESLGRGGITEGFGSGHAVLARIQQARGDQAAAREAVRTACQLAGDSGIKRMETHTCAYQVRIWLAQGLTDRASAWARGYECAAETEYIREFEDLTLVRVYLAQSRGEKASSLLDTLSMAARPANRMATVLECLVLQALACAAAGHLDASMASLAQAVTLAQPEGYVRVFLDEGQPMLDLLRRGTTRTGLGSQVPYIRRLLAEWTRWTADQDAHPNGSQEPLIEPLTERERHVLQLLAQELTNAEIAQRLYISLPTVKTHTRNLYGKLGVHSRREAVTQARLLGLL